MKIFRATFLVCFVAATLSSTAIAAKKTQPLKSYPAGTDIPARFTLLAKNGDSGRSSMIMHGYRPQIKFSGTKGTVTCAINMKPDLEMIDPGQTAPVRINCDAKFDIIVGQPHFKAYEGGRLVGEGDIQ